MGAFWTDFGPGFSVRTWTKDGDDFRDEAFGHLRIVLQYVQDEIKGSSSRLSGNRLGLEVRLPICQPSRVVEGFVVPPTPSRLVSHWRKFARMIYSSLDGTRGYL